MPGSADLSSVTNQRTRGDSARPRLCSSSHSAPGSSSYSSKHKREICPLIQLIPWLSYVWPRVSCGTRGHEEGRDSREPTLMVMVMPTAALAGGESSLERDHLTARDSRKFTLRLLPAWACVNCDQQLCQSLSTVCGQVCSCDSL